MLWKKGKKEGCFLARTVDVRKKGGKKKLSYCQGEKTQAALSPAEEGGGGDPYWHSEVGGGSCAK